MADRLEDRKEALRREMGYEPQAQEPRPKQSIPLRQEEETQEEYDFRVSKMDPRSKDNWRFSLGKYKWGFWALAIAFVLFMATWYIIKPLLHIDQTPTWAKAVALVVFAIIVLIGFMLWAFRGKGEKDV